MALTCFLPLIIVICEGHFLWGMFIEKENPLPPLRMWQVNKLLNCPHYPRMLVKPVAQRIGRSVVYKEQNH